MPPKASRKKAASKKATSKKATSSSARRPARSLIALLVVMVLGAGLMFALDAKSPKLGLDLAGGSQVTLIPRLQNSSSGLSSTQLSQSVDIIRQRVNGLGVSEADVQTQGSNIIVSVPGATGDQALETIAQTALLRFRPVVTSEQVVPTAVTAPPAAPGTAPSGAPSAGTPGTPAPSAPAPAPSAPAPSPSAPAATGSAPAGTVAPRAAVAPAPVALAAATPAPTAPAPAGSTKAPAAPTAPAPAATKPPGLLTDPADPATPSQPSAAVQAEYAALDCNLPKNRTGGSADKPADAFIAACDQKGTEKFILGPTAIEGTEISNASAGQQQNGGQYIVQLEFTGTGTKQFGDVTTKLYQSGGRFAIVLDNVVVSAPGLTSGPILGGQAEISGDFTLSTAQDLAQVLKFGALPVTFDPGEVLQVSATVGADQLNKGILAGGIGLILVIIYSLLFYRALGIVSIFSLVVAGALTYGLTSLMGAAIGFRLILAGVIGVIVSIGITADSFVVYFERVRDEIREGRTIRVAVEKAWPRARRTILVADSVTFLAALVLYFLSIGRVQNFAFTLGLTTVIDVLVVFFFTKPLVTLLVQRPFFRDGHSWSGLNPESIGATSQHTSLATRMSSGASTTAGESA